MYFHHISCLVSIINLHTNTVYMSQNEVENEVENEAAVVERGSAAFNVVCLVLNEVLCIQRGIMHLSTRLRRVEPRLPRLRRGKRGVFCLTRYYALFPTPNFRST